MTSLLETLRCIFPLIVANRIYYFYVSNQKLTIKNELIDKFNHGGIKNILQIKNAIPAYWLINFENENIKQYKYTSKRIYIFNNQLKKVLIENHNFIKKWRIRQCNKLNINL